MHYSLMSPASHSSAVQCERQLPANVLEQSIKEKLILLYGYLSNI